MCHKNVLIASDYFWRSCINRASVFEWYMIFKKSRVSVRDDERCGEEKGKVNTPKLIGQ